MLCRALMIAAALCGTASCSRPTQRPAKPEGRWVDLTHALAEDSAFWPTAEGFSHEVAAYGPTPGGWFYSSYNLQLSEHGGTISTRQSISRLAGRRPTGFRSTG